MQRTGGLHDYRFFGNKFPDVVMHYASFDFQGGTLQFPILLEWSVVAALRPPPSVRPPRRLGDRRSGATASTYPPSGRPSERSVHLLPPRPPILRTAVDLSSGVDRGPWNYIHPTVDRGLTGVVDLDILRGLGHPPDGPRSDVLRGLGHPPDDHPTVDCGLTGVHLSSGRPSERSVHHVSQ